MKSTTRALPLGLVSGDVRITADTNILLRAILGDDAQQAQQARALLETASLVTVPIPVLCELVWTMRRLYKRRPDEIAEAVSALLLVTTVVTDRLAAEAGLAVLQAGGDFADGVIAWQGAQMGADVFATFDREGIRRLEQCGRKARTPAQLLDR
jgi:predicted nucleic-acid-binding protein